MGNKEIKIPFTNEKTNSRELFSHSIINFFYGFVTSMLPTGIYIAMETNQDFIVAIVAFLYVTFLSQVLNRKAYSTWLGKFVLFPISYTAGFYVSFQLCSILKTLL